MPYEDSLQQLLELFLEYKRARSPRVRLKLEEEILQLFDTLGASLPPKLLSVRGEFEEMREKPDLEVSPEKELRRASHRFAGKRIALIAGTPGAVELSWGARELLRVPLIETYESAEFRDADLADHSLQLVAESLQEKPRTPSEGHGQLRTSVAVIRAFAKNFCNIPPFCSGKQYE
jgi:hypothetical protein